MRRPRSTVAYGLIISGIVFAAILLVAPLLLIVSTALSRGWSAVAHTLQNSDTQHAIQLTLLTVVLTVPINIVFGVGLAWCVTRFDFIGKRLLVALVDIPFAMSPVVAGLCYLLLYGLQSSLGQWLDAHGIQLMFAWPGIALVTLFVTCPYTARVLIPLMQEQGTEEEEAALSLGASGWQMFRRITLPKIRWGLLYGVLLTSARAAGEFGAVSVVSGTIRGQTMTLPLQVELLHQDYNSVGAFSAAALLMLLALISLLAKAVIERLQQQKMRGSVLIGHAVADNNSTTRTSADPN
jgi:sulfate transport system permease protein